MEWGKNLAFTEIALQYTVTDLQMIVCWDIFTVYYYYVWTLLLVLLVWMWTTNILFLLCTLSIQGCVSLSTLRGKSVHWVKAFINIWLQNQRINESLIWPWSSTKHRDTGDKRVTEGSLGVEAGSDSMGVSRTMWKRWNSRKMEKWGDERDRCIHFQIRYVWKVW